MRKKVLALGLTLLWVGVLAFAKSSLLESIGKKGSVIDWSKGKVVAKGEGLGQRAANPFEAEVYAKKAALVDARRELLGVVKGVRVNSETVVKKLYLENDEIREEIEGVIEGYTIAKENCEKSEGYAKCEVILTVGMDDIKDAVVKELFPENFKRSRKTEPEKSQKGAPTGIVIDTKGLKVKPAMFPRILDEDGNVLFSGKNVDLDYALETGIVSYANKKEKLNKERVGTNPMTVTALERKGKLKADVVISREDARKIAQANQRGHFLERCNVGFLVD